ncbi:transposase [Candidatus Calescamantes bacterium]|nr:transposase [Candidatus Calescamantes bacterium]
MRLAPVYLLLIYLGYADSERSLLRRLKFDRKTSFLCGFSYYETPLHNTFHYFRKRVRKETFQRILSCLIAQAVAIIKRDKLRVSMDSIHLGAFKTDHDGKLRAKFETFFFFGQKIHLVANNTELPIPLAVEISPSNNLDGEFIIPLIKEAKKFPC